MVGACTQGSARSSHGHGRPRRGFRSCRLRRNAPLPPAGREGPTSAHARCWNTACGTLGALRIAKHGELALRGLRNRPDAGVPLARPRRPRCGRHRSRPRRRARHVVRLPDADAPPAMRKCGSGNERAGSAVGAISANPADFLPGRLRSVGPDSGYCGSAGSDGPNRACAGCGAVVATEWGDCWTQAEIRFRLEKVRAG